MPWIPMRWHPIHSLPRCRIPMSFPYNGGNTGAAYHLHILNNKAQNPWHRLQQATPRRTSARPPRLSLTGQSSLLALSPAYSSSSSSVSQC